MERPLTPQQPVTELVLVSPQTTCALRPSTGRKRKITPSKEELTPRKVAVITWPEPTLSATGVSSWYQWSPAPSQAHIDSRLPYVPSSPNPLYSGPEHIPVRHIVLSANLLKDPDQFYDEAFQDHVFNIFPNTVALSKSAPFLQFGMTTLPPKPWPKSVTGLIPYFYVTDTAQPMPPPPGPTQSPLPMGRAAPPRNVNLASHLDGRDMTNWEPIFNALIAHFEDCGVEVTEIMYWYNYVTIVLKNKDADPTKLPRRVGRLSCGYFFEDEMGRSKPPSARRLVDPSPGNPDVSTYNELQPGLRITSDYMLPKREEFMATTTGVLVKDKVGTHFMTAAAHGFPAEFGNRVFHPNPQGRPIGELIMELDHSDIALVLLGGDEIFNVTWENHDTPQSQPLSSLISAKELHMGDAVWMDTPDTGSIEGAFVTTSFLRIPSENPFEREQRWVTTEWLYMGQDAEDLPEGIHGAAIMTDQDDVMHVAGFVRNAPRGGPMAGYCQGIAADELIRHGFTLVTR